MRNIKALANKNSFSLIQVNELNENGDIISTSYEVVNPDGDVMGRFDSINEAEDFFESIQPEPINVRPRFKM